MKLTGYDAIEFAEKEGLSLNKAADQVDPPRSGLTVAEAAAIADADPELIWLEVDDALFHSDRRNPEPER